MNCQAEIPVARVTTNSLVRVKRQKAAMPPNRMANGKVFCPMNGSFRRDISMTIAKVTESCWAVRRSNSTESNSRISIRNRQKMPRKLIRKCRPI